jgi:hypothetical protein
VFVDRRTLVMLALGFSAGLPFLLVFDTLSAWLRAAGLSLQVIGFFSLVTMVYSFKFLWAPLVDRTRVPILTAWDIAIDAWCIEAADVSSRDAMAAAYQPESPIMGS